MSNQCCQTDPVKGHVATEIDQQYPVNSLNNNFKAFAILELLIEQCITSKWLILCLFSLKNNS